MSLREYRDRHGVAWRVWPVRPGDLMRLSGDAPDAGSRTRRAPGVRAEFREGWLAFESRGERFRVAPVPDAWELLSDEELDGLRAQGARVPRQQRLLE